GASNLFWLPVMGTLSDRIGRRPLLVMCTTLMLITAYPAMLWLVRDPSFSRLLGVELWLSFIYGSYNGAMVVFLTEIMPVSVRTSGFALAYSLATAIFGGFTPAISTYLIHVTGDRAVPGLWLSFAALCGLAAVALAPKQAGGTAPLFAGAAEAAGCSAAVDAAPRGYGMVESRVRFLSAAAWSAAFALRPASSLSCR